MSNTKRGLGKGLNALIADMDGEVQGITTLKINDIEPGDGQPRKAFDDTKLVQLSESIKQHGIIQPIIVKKEGEVYKIIAGERRWRAAKLAGFKEVPVIIKNITNKEVMEVALIENIQREDLNPVEEAEAFERLIKEYEITQDELSKIVGKSRPAITNSLRLLALPQTIKRYLISGSLTSGHARAVLSIEDDELRYKVCNEIINNELSVRATEQIIKNITTPKKKSAKRRPDPNFIAIQNRLQEFLKTKVSLKSNNKKGKILIEYYSNDELERILDIIGLNKS